MKNLTRGIALVLALVMLLAFAGCQPAPTDPATKPTQPQEGTKPSDGTEPPYAWVDDGKQYTYHTYNTVSPSNWNELTYQDANDSTLISYLNSSFFSFDFKFDEFGEIVPGEFTISWQAAVGLEDVTAKYAEAWGLNPESKGFAWQITLRDGLKWENGDPIVAGDFVYTMQQQLDPLFQNYRADSFYAGSVNLVGAQAYAKQGQSGWFKGNEAYAEYSEAIDADLIFTLGPASEVNSYIRDWVGFPDSWDLAATVAYLQQNYGFPCSAEEIAQIEGKSLAEIKADESLNAIWTNALGWWKTEPNEELHFFATHYTFPETAWEKVGLLAPDDHTLVVIMTNPIELIDEEGNMTYHCAYDFSGLPLVHKATYEANKHKPVEGSTLWTSTYNSSVETSMSWGAYKLQSYQAGKEWTVVRNTNWYGYALEENEGLYMTDTIVEEIVDEWGTAWLKFLAGEIDGIGIDPQIAAEYKGSSRAYFTPDDYIQSAQLQSSKEGLEARESEGVNKTILTYKDFRNAMSLAVDRADYAAKCTTSSLAGFGIFNSMHYYDVANGGVYRNTDEAKEILCKTYGVDVSKYASLDEAVESITGYNLEAAKALIEKAYAQALADGEISATDKVVLTFGTSVDNEATRRHFDYLSKAWTEMCVGTSLEGRIEFEFNSSFGDNWSKDFRSGGYDICLGGWSGAAWDPGYFLLAYLDPGYMYSTAWDTSATMMEFTMKGVGENGADITDTMSLTDWYACLNGLEGCKYDWSEAALPNAQRLQLIAALEGQILQVYYTVPMYYSFGASLLSYKVDYITYEYNTFMGYGGLKYMTYNFDDAGWAAEVEAEGGEIDYKK
jgi:oligopeptide transport system substrate-binding protein